MFEKFKDWCTRHPKTVLVVSLLTVVGTTAIFFINGKKVRIPISELFPKKAHGGKPAVPSPVVVDAIKKAVVDAPVAEDTIQNVASALSPVAVDAIEDINNSTKTFQRSGYIRQYSGRNASPIKIAQAEQMGIDLKPGQTIVDPCTVTWKCA